MSNLYFVQNILNEMKGLKTRNVQLGHGSFLTIDFGQDLLIRIKTNHGIEEFKRGEWHLWTYICAWRLDIKGIPIIGSEDERKKIAKEIVKLENKELVNIEILNEAFDIVLKFENEIVLLLFSFSVKEFEHWKLYTPERKALIVGPGMKVSYKNEGSS